ncbi:putative nuclease HARBI1 [Branchiostoma lanceolatum]|uniref:putative nuclease HARBI1 n=1 Tax=Branchiostoma lanceolatum TaxID=7740 RepID=UPI003452A679
MDTTASSSSPDVDYDMDATISQPDLDVFLVLFRLKVGLFHKDLAVRFGLSESSVSRIVGTWINFLYVEIPALFPFPSQTAIRAAMPVQFSKYPTTRIIIDCTEIFIEAPSAMLAQSQTWSSYKHHNTWKSLVGITPNGLITFVSKLWTGRVSDKAITKDSGLLDKLQAGDNVMADRGFEIADILPQGVTLNIPPFKGSRDALSPSEVQETMDIASVRIHVERAIGRIKNFHILDGVMPITLFPHADQLFTVCAYLTNFSPPLVKND